VIVEVVSGVYVRANGVAKGQNVNLCLAPLTRKEKEKKKKDKPVSKSLSGVSQELKKGCVCVE
jgi:hypothetical protein